MSRGLAWMKEPQTPVVRKAMRARIAGCFVAILLVTLPNAQARAGQMPQMPQAPATPQAPTTADPQSIQSQAGKVKGKNAKASTQPAQAKPAVVPGEIIFRDQKQPAED